MGTDNGSIMATAEKMMENMQKNNYGRIEGFQETCSIVFVHRPKDHTITAETKTKGVKPPKTAV